MLGGGFELLQAGRAEVGGLEEAEELVAIDDGQPAIHAVVEGDAPAGEVETNGQRRQSQDVAEEANGVVVGCLLYTSDAADE